MQERDVELQELRASQAASSRAEAAVDVAEYVLTNSMQPYDSSAQLRGQGAFREGGSIETAARSQPSQAAEGFSEDQFLALEACSEAWQIHLANQVCIQYAPRHLADSKR